MKNNSTMTRTTFAFIVDTYTTAALPPPRLCDGYAPSLPQLFATPRYRIPTIVATPLPGNDLPPSVRQPRSTLPRSELPQHQKHFVACMIFLPRMTLQSKVSYSHPIYIILHPLCRPPTTITSYSAYYPTTHNPCHFAHCTRKCSHIHHVCCTWNLQTRQSRQLLQASDALTTAVHFN